MRDRQQSNQCEYKITDRIYSAGNIYIYTQGLSKLCILRKILYKKENKLQFIFSVS